MNDDINQVRVGVSFTNHRHTGSNPVSDTSFGESYITHVKFKKIYYMQNVEFIPVGFQTTGSFLKGEFHDNT